jgi:hypothetical protein
MLTRQTAAVFLLFAFALAACYPTEIYKINISSDDNHRRAQEQVQLPSTPIPLTSKPASATTANSGLVAIVSNPSVPASQAYSICSPQAQNAKRQASQASDIGNSSVRCNSYGDQITCNSGLSGGVWAGINAGLDSVMSGKSAYKSVMSSCLAQYGWQE